MIWLNLKPLYTFKLLDDISDKSCKFYMQNLDFLYEKISLQEEFEALKRMEKDKGRQVTERILLLSADLLKVEGCEVSTEDVIDQPHNTDDDLLLDIVLCDMRASTLCY